MGDPYGATPAPKAVTDTAPRCWKCNRLLAELVTRPWSIRCSRCKSTNQMTTGVATVTVEV